MGTRRISAVPEQIDLALYQSDDFRLRITVTDGATPFDLTGWTPRSEIRETKESETVLAEFVATVEDAAAGTMLLHLPSALADQLFPDGAVWDVQITGPTGEILTLLFGGVTMHEEVTRP